MDVKKKLNIINKCLNYYVNSINITNKYILFKYGLYFKICFKYYCYSRLEYHSNTQISTLNSDLIPENPPRRLKIR